MAIMMVVRAAMTVSVASALVITENAVADEIRRGKRSTTHLIKRGAMDKVQWPMETDLPRTVLQSNNSNSSGCGVKIPGYFMIESLLWESTWPIEMKKSDGERQCAKACEKATDCVGFSARQPTKGRMQCHLYKGLHQKLHRGHSFVRCVPGFQCQKGLPGFQFSHAGTWRDGKQIETLDGEAIEECAMACRRNRACVGFTHFVGHDEDKYCFHFENENNKEGPRRDMRAFSYARCTSEITEIPKDSMLLLQSLEAKKNAAVLVSEDEQTEENNQVVQNFTVEPVLEEEDPSSESEDN
jgi:hypothetical protein